MNKLISEHKQDQQNSYGSLKMRNGIILLFVLFMLLGCSCNCPQITPPSTGDYTTASSSIILYSDACAPTDGTSATEGKSYSSATPVPNAQCDNWTGGSPSNRGRWVMVPPPNSSTGGGAAGGLSIANDSTVIITTYGTVYYCSSGYDNVHISPYISAFPGEPINGEFSDNTQMAVEEGQLIILNIGDPSSGCAYTPSNTFCSPGNGVAIGATGNTALALPICASNQYSSFLSGKCRGTGGFGLSVYIDSKEVVTLDEQNYTGNNSFYTYSTSRTPNLYSPLIPSGELQSFFNTVNTDYSEQVSPAGPIQYVFIAPYTGLLSVGIAEGASSTTGTPKGYGQYNVTVLTAPSSCAVSNSETLNEDDRGAVQVLFEASGVDPNNVDNVLETFNYYDPTLSIYYPELMQYLASKANVQISSNAAALDSLLVPSTGTNPYTGGPANYNPSVLTSQVSTLYSAINGYIWLKVRDDYYNDNVGAYKVNIQVQTPTASVVSEFLNDLMTPINDSLQEATVIIYSNFFSPSNNFTEIIHMSLLLYVMVFGGQYLLGLNSFSLRDSFIRVLKISVIVELLQPTSWEFYNQYFFNVYLQGQNFLISAVTGDYSTNYQGVFGFVDDVFSIFFSAYTWQQLLALLPDIIGILYAFVLIMVMAIYLITLCQVFVFYLLSLVGMYILIALAPMFMVTLLFERTKRFFLNWVKYLFSFAIQPVILFAVLYVMNEIFMVLWENAMSFDICWGGVWTLYFYGVYIWTFGAVEPFTIGCVWYYGIMNELPIYEMFAEVLMLYFFVLNTQGIIAYGPKIADSISGTATATSLAKISAGVVASAGKMVTGDPIAKAEKADRQNAKQAREDKFATKMDSKKRNPASSEDNSNNKQRTQKTSPQSNAKSSSSSTKDSK